VQTEAGLLTFAVPQLRSTDEPFRPQLPERLATRTPDLETLVRGMYVRGLSTQDIGALYGETFGETRLSKSTVSRITQQLTQEFEAWRRRDLSELAVVYLFLDGQYHAARRAPTRRKASSRRMRCSKTARRCCCTWTSARENRMTPGSVFCKTWWRAGCARRCWS